MKSLLLLGIICTATLTLKANEVSIVEILDQELADVGVGIYSGGYYRNYPNCGPNGYYVPGYYGRRFGLGYYFGPGAGYYYRPRCYYGRPRYYYYPYWGPGWRGYRR